MSSFGAGNYKILKFRVQQSGTGAQEQGVYTCPDDKVAQAYVYTIANSGAVNGTSLVVKWWLPDTQAVGAPESVTSIANSPGSTTRPSGVSGLDFNAPAPSAVASMGPGDFLKFRSGGSSGTISATIVVIEFGRNND